MTGQGAIAETHAAPDGEPASISGLPWAPSAMTVFCEAELTYVATRDGFLGRGPRSGPAAAGPTRVEIRDGRTADLPGWRECGFELVPHASAVTDWDDDDDVATIHYPEVEALARDLTGADHALVSSHIRRNPHDATHRHADLAPIRVVHSDFAAGHDDLIRSSYTNRLPGPTATLDRLGLDAAVVTDAPRIVVLQFWRNLGPAKMDFPLGFCDVRSVTPDQGHAVHVEDYAGSGANFDALAVARPGPGDPDHEWYAFGSMRPDETVAFRTYDSDVVAAGGVYFTPHCAFHDPEVEVGRPARSSIELRATCVFE